MQRLISHVFICTIYQEGVPEEIKKAKINQIKELRKKSKYLKEVEMFDARYKKIKFIGKLIH